MERSMKKHGLAAAMGAAVIGLMPPLGAPAQLAGAAHAQTAAPTPAQRALVAQMNGTVLSQSQRQTIAAQLVAQGVGPSAVLAVLAGNPGAAANNAAAFV